MSPETHKPAAADNGIPCWTDGGRTKLKRLTSNAAPGAKAEELKERGGAHRDTQKSGPVSSNTTSPAMPPQAPRKSPSCSSLRSGCAGEWSLATMSMVPFCAHRDTHSKVCRNAAFASRVECWNVVLAATACPGEWSLATMPMGAVSRT